jgi:hypothetical protein
MIITENECVDCGLPCIYESCPYWAVTRFYCDECNNEVKLYWWDGQQLCLDCIEARLERVEYYDE